MKIVFDWLKDFVSTDKNPFEIAHDLESIGHEVESIKNWKLSNVVIGEILEVTKHPNADRLSVTKVNTGNKINTIVCGAPNVEVGQKVAVALPGTTLPNGLTIEARAVRGIPSEGMICAEDELGVGTNHDGILVLEESRTIGEQFFGDNESIVFDLSITPNRGDAVSVLGIARELGARWDINLDMPAINFEVTPQNQPQIIVESLDLCPSYTARYINNIEPNELPEKISDRLKATDHSQYHPIVDLTNYVMEELGLPLHAFDADKIVEPIIIRKAHDGETIELLDGQTYSLTNTMLVIADQNGPIALAGIMGGKHSSITPQTKRVVLEAAAFDPISIRKTRQMLKLQSDASYRYERGVDQQLTQIASDRFSYLANKYLNASIGEINKIENVRHEKAIDFNPEKINKFLGTSFNANEIISKMNRLGFIVEGDKCHVPSWRHDVSIEVDIYEEIARIFGFEQIPHIAVADQTKQPTQPDSTFHQIEWLKDDLARLGWTEHIGSSFISEKDSESLGYNQQELIAPLNPVSEEAKYLRPDLLSSLIRAIAKNPIFSELNYFELGTIFEKYNDDSTEKKVLGLLTTFKDQKLPDYFSVNFEKISDSILQAYKIRKPLYFAQINRDTLLESIPDNKLSESTKEISVSFNTPTRYQATVKDIAILVDQEINPEQIIEKLKNINEITNIELFDHYEGPQLPNNKQSLAYHILLENENRNLEATETEAIIQKVKEILQTEFNATIR